ncbi:potassium transporter TrkG, partial [Pantoea sp. SIMBA_133]
AILACGIGGMAPVDAVVHAMSSGSTGGFANSDASFGAYADQPHLLWMGTLFMLLGALPFVLYIRFLRGSPLALWRDEQVRGL